MPCILIPLFTDKIFGFRIKKIASNCMMPAHIFAHTIVVHSPKHVVLDSRWFCYESRRHSLAEGENKGIHDA